MSEATEADTWERMSESEYREYRAGRAAGAGAFLARREYRPQGSPAARIGYEDGWTGAAEKAEQN